MRNLRTLHRHIRVAVRYGIVLALLGGCGGSDFETSGGLEASWAVGGATCSAAGISTVRVSIFDQVGLYTSETTPCQLGKIEMAEVPTGAYTIQVDGFRAGSDLPIYSGTIAGIQVRPGTVTVAPRVEMAEMPGGVDITWRFDTGDLCGFVGVDTIIINVWDNHSNRIYEESLPCDPFTARLAAEETIPGRVLYDNARGIVIPQLYAGQYTLRAFGMQAGVDLHPKYWAEAHPVVTHSKLTPVDLTLKSCEVENPDGSTSTISICY